MLGVYAGGPGDRAGRAHVWGCYRGGCEEAAGCPGLQAGAGVWVKGQGPALAHGAPVEMALHTVGLHLLLEGGCTLNRP